MYMSDFIWISVSVLFLYIFVLFFYIYMYKNLVVLLSDVKMFNFTLFID